MSTKRVILEALNICNKIANSITKKLNYVESSIILDGDFESIKNYLYKTAKYHSNAFDELDNDQKQDVLKRVYDNIHSTMRKEYTENSDLSQEELEQRIYNFLKMNGGIMYPLEHSAKRLAQEIKRK